MPLGSPKSWVRVPPGCNLRAHHPDRVPRVDSAGEPHVQFSVVVLAKAIAPAGNVISSRTFPAFSVVLHR